MDDEWAVYNGAFVENWHQSARRFRLASNATEIPIKAFDYCNALQSISIPSAVTAV